MQLFQSNRLNDDLNRFSPAPDGYFDSCVYMVSYSVAGYGIIGVNPMLVSRGFTFDNKLLVAVNEGTLDTFRLEQQGYRSLVTYRDIHHVA